MKYTAFISYNSKDNNIARWLQKRLEKYSLPSVISNEKGEIVRSYDKKTEKFRIFRYVTDLVAQNLNDGLKHELDQSKFLIIICSPNSANATWVRKEVKHFIDTGRKNMIIPFVIKGIPYSNDRYECFTPELKEAYPDGSALGVNINDSGDDLWIFRKRKAVAKVVSLLIDLPNAYDFIWNRYKASYIRTLLLRAIMALLITILITLSTLWTKRIEGPFDMHIQLTEESGYPHLPAIHDIEVTTIIGDGKPVSDTIKSLAEPALFTPIPGRLKDKQMRLIVQNADCHRIDTLIYVRENINIPLYRNASRYGKIKILLIYNEEPLRDCTVEVEGVEYRTGADGILEVEISPTFQKEKYRLTYKNSHYTIDMPCEGTRCMELN